MPILDLVVEAIKSAGSKYLSDLSHVKDLQTVRHVAEKLIELNNESQSASLEGEKRDCKEQAEQWMDTLKVLALSRVNTEDQDLVRNLEVGFVKAVITGISPVLGSLVSILLE